MKVTVEIPNDVIKRTSYIYLSQASNEVDEELVHKAVEVCEKEESITVSTDIFDENRNQVQQLFAIGALATIIKELCENSKTTEDTEDHRD